MNKHFKRGLISMSLWILFVIVVFGSYLYITKRPFSYFIDEETGGFISATFFLSWALIWFGIGQHYSKDYDIKRNIFEQKNQGIDTKYLNLMFRKTYFANFAKTLSFALLYFCSVLFGSQRKRFTIFKRLHNNWSTYAAFYHFLSIL